MRDFIAKHQQSISGSLSGFDRVRFRGTLRVLAVAQLLVAWLNSQAVLLKDFAGYAESITARLQDAIETIARECLRARGQLNEKSRRSAISYLPSSAISKEELVAQVIQRRGIREGLVAVLSCVEPCRSFEVRRNPDLKQLELVPAIRRCLHWYVYLIDPVLGLCHVRIQSWLPFTVHVCVNGREMLCQELTRRGIGFERRDNTLAKVADVEVAQQILNAQPWDKWGERLEQLVRRVCPPLRELPGFHQEPLRYYWSADETEWATDVMFKSAEQLAELYPLLLTHAMSTFDSQHVMRFLGKVRIPKVGVDPRFNGEVTSKLLVRPEGVCVKHQLERNTLKMYDKQGSVLRVETTINDAQSFGVYRASENNPTGPKKWQRLRKGVVDLPQRARVSQAANERYLQAQAAVDNATPLGKLVDQLARPVVKKHARSRGLNPLTGIDHQIIAILLRGEFALNGFRNSDVREHLFGSTKPRASHTKKSPKPAHQSPRSATSPAETSQQEATDSKAMNTAATPGVTATDTERDQERRRQSSQITRLLRLFRAHSLIRKIPKTHRYQLTAAGRRILPTFTLARLANTKHLQQTTA